MKKLILMILLTMVASHLFSQCAVPANIYTFTYAGKTYEVIKEKKTWSAAAACAVERGGYLVEINDQAEQNAVYDAIVNGAGVQPNYTSVPMGGGIAYVWIGATDQQTEGTWVWDGNNDNTGTSFWTGQGANGSGNGASVGGAYFNWGGTSTGTPNEPDDYANAQDHAAIGLAGWPSGSSLLGSAGEWNDIPGASSLYFVVEYNSGTGMNDFPEEDGVKIYPNPAALAVHISSPGAPFSVEITNLLGEKVHDDAIRQTHKDIDLSAFKNGLYCLKVYRETTVYTGKLLVKNSL